MKLNDRICKTATREKNGRKLGDGKGLYLELNANGGKYWRYKYRINGKEKLLSLGVYPEITLADARELHREAHKLVSGGIDPSQTKKQHKALQRSNADNTFKTVAIDWHDTKKSEWTDAYALTILNRMEADIFPKIGTYPIADITPPILLSMLKEIESRGVYETTRRARQYCSQIFRYAVATGKAQRDITVDLRGAIKSKKAKHHNSIDIKELPELLSKLAHNEARMYRPTILAVRMLMLTFVRTSELIEARWDEIDWREKQWVIPAERMKMNKSHIVPLSKQAIAILKELKTFNGHREWIFASHVKPKNHMSNNTVLSWSTPIF